MFSDEAKFRSLNVLNVFKNHLIETYFIVRRNTLIEYLFGNIPITPVRFTLFIEYKQHFFECVLGVEIVLFILIADFAAKGFWIDLSLFLEYLFKKYRVHTVTKYFK